MYLAGRRTAVAAVLLLFPLAAHTQVQQGAIARTLAPAGASASALAHYNAGMADFEARNVTGARRHFAAALAEDPTFGLARTQVALATGGVPSQKEHARAVTDASKGSAGETMLALAYREGAFARAANARAIWDALASMYPDDRFIALERARSRVGAERLQAIRDVARQHPDYAPARGEVAIALVLSQLTRYPKEVADEALSHAQAVAQRLPNAAGTHFLLGFVHERLLNHDEARMHLDKAIAIEAFGGHYELKAEMAAREKKAVLARALLDSAIAFNSSPVAKIVARRDQAILRGYDGTIADVVAALAPIAKQAEADSLPGQASATHLTIALFRAAARDASGYEAAVAEAKRVQPTSVALADNQIISYGLLGDGPKARAVLPAYIEGAQSQAPAMRDENVHRMTGVVAFAEGKYDEAIMHLKQGGPNPYVEVFTIEALMKQGKAKEAAAVRTALLARKNVSLAATSIPIAIQRAKMKK